MSVMVTRAGGREGSMMMFFFRCAPSMRKTSRSSVSRRSRVIGVILAKGPVGTGFFTTTLVAAGSWTIFSAFAEVMKRRV